MKLLEQIAQDLYDGNDEKVVDLVKEALAAGTEPEEVLDQGLIAGMDEVGRDFKAGDLYVPEVLIAAKAMSAGMEILRPLLAAGSASRAGKCIIGTVKGDLHDIGKNLVKMMLEGAGFELIDLGTDVEADAFVDAVRSHDATLLGMSALLTTTMTNMKTVIDQLEEAGLRSSIKVMIGGAPVTAEFCQQIGADGYAADAATAVDVARNLAA